MNPEIETILNRALIALIMRVPFWGTLSMQLKYIEDDTLETPTLATDGRCIYMHPDWMRNNELNVIQSGIAHEIGHVVCEHLARIGERDDAERWNHAIDYEVNALLKDSGMHIPDTWLYSSAFNGMSAEAIYALLPPTPSGGNKAGGQKPLDQHRKLDPGLDKKEHAQDWKDAVQRAVEACGDVPDNLKRFIDEVLREPADWRAVMSRFATVQAKEDYSFTRMNKMFASQGIFLPGLYSERMGEISVMIDTSGSITKNVLDAFGAHVKEIVAQTKPMNLNVIYCDARVNHVDDFEENDEAVFEAHGGGGTDFRPPFKWIEENTREPVCAMYLTDGYGPFPEVEPPYPVLWLMTTEVKPPWGEVVRIEI